MVQYLFDKEEHEIVHSKPHNNSKGLLPYRRLFTSTLDLMKTSQGQPKKEFDMICSSVGDVVHARSIGELPGGLQDLYSLDIKFAIARNLTEITKLNRLFSWLNCEYYSKKLKVVELEKAKLLLYVSVAYIQIF